MLKKGNTISDGFVGEVKAILGQAGLSWYRLAQAVLGVMSFHALGFILGLPRQAWGLIDWASLTNISSQLAVYLILGIVVFGFSKSQLHSVEGFRNFLLAKFALRPRVSIHDIRKHRWMQVREAATVRFLDIHGTALAATLGSFAFFIVYLGTSTSNVVVAIFMFIAFSLLGLRSKKYPKAFSNLAFWINDKVGNSLLITLIILVSVVTGYSRQEFLSKNPHGVMLINQVEAKVSLMTYSSLGPIFFDHSTNEYLVFENLPAVLLISD